MGKKEQKESKARLEEVIKRMRKSGLKVTNLADKGIKSIGFTGGVRHPGSVPAQDENDSDSARKPVN